MADAWTALKKYTQARIGLDRSGHAVGTTELLKFQRAHAQARDAVWSHWDVAQLLTSLKDDSQSPIILNSRTSDRAEYLKRPDLGRRLSSSSYKLLANSRAVNELCFVVSDGLSAKSIADHFLPFWKVFAPKLEAAGWPMPQSIALIPFGRVAISDEVGELNGAKLSVIFIGERPGLSSTDSMGIYLTYDPKVSNTDANRNCISNIRPPDGLGYEHAADKLIYLIRESLRLKLSGPSLKEAEIMLPASTD